jgi:hypothetical protein
MLRTRIAKIKDGRTDFVHKAEHALDVKTRAVPAVTLLEAGQGELITPMETLTQAGEHDAELMWTKEPIPKPKMHRQIF